MVEGDYGALVRARPAAAWRETLAVLATFSAPEQWGELCGALAAKLDAAGERHAAMLCHVCACNVDGAIAHWGAPGALSGAVNAGGALPRPETLIMSHKGQVMPLW